MTSPQWPKNFDRAEVHFWIEDVIEHGLSVEDSFADTLIATAQSLGLTPITLKLWIYDQPKTGGWDIHALGAWARRMGFTVAEDKSA